METRPSRAGWRLTMLSRPRFVIVYKGVDISSEVAPHLISCTYTDKVHGEADEIEVAVQDARGLWRGAWCPEHGDVVKLWIGYEGGMMLPCGDFEVDEPNASIGRGGDTMTFRGVSAPVSKALRTRKTVAFEEQSMAQIAGEIAGEHGLSVVGSPPDVRFKRVTQRRERDLEFLSRMADAYGAYFTVKGDQLVFERRDDVHKRSPVMTLSTASRTLISADLKRAAHGTYSKAKASYFDRDEKREIKAEAADPDVKTGDTLRIDDRVENEAQAQARAKSELQKANMKKMTASVTVVGNPTACAGTVVTLGGGFGKWARRYVVATSRHTISRAGGYVTALELEGV